MCLSCLVQLLEAVTLNRALTHMHTLSTRNREASAIHLPETLRPASIEQNHFLLILPCPPFHLKGLWSWCITLNRPVKRQGVGGWVEGTLTGVVPPASTPTTITIIMTTMTKMMTQRNVVLLSYGAFDPRFTSRK